MLYTRPTTYLTLAVILLCTVYWISRATFHPQTDFFSANSIVHEDETGTLIYKNPSSDSPQPNELTDHDLSVQAEEDDNYFSKEQSSTEGQDQQQQQQEKTKFPARFPRQIWQTSSNAALDKYFKQIATWKNIRGFEYRWLSDDDATAFVRSKFSHRPSIIALWEGLSSSNQIVLRADLLRYLIMLSEGGVYSDIDTSVLKHPDVWIPGDLGAMEINAIVGIEYDDNTYPMFVRPISFCQWTLMSKPNHPIFEAAVERVLSNLEFLARRQRVNMTDLKLDKMDVIEATGPGMISDVVMQVIRDSSPGQDIAWSTFHNQMTATLYGDVLVLPINGFAGAQKHSHAGNPEYGDMFVQHHFGRSWYAPQKAGSHIDKEKQASGDGAAKVASQATVSATIPSAVTISTTVVAAQQSEVEDFLPAKEEESSSGEEPSEDLKDRENA